MDLLTVQRRDLRPAAPRPACRDPDRRGAPDRERLREFNRRAMPGVVLDDDELANPGEAIPHLLDFAGRHEQVGA
ncbi:hypothetical protein [Nocardia sp. NPDC057353]|uniref:hypothetical protein n=1 Tax=Nocardia sp. NPDC057353 TaxID=3346104 RepID=UPI0036261BA5